MRVQVGCPAHTTLSVQTTRADAHTFDGGAAMFLYMRVLSYQLASQKLTPVQGNIVQDMHPRLHRKHLGRVHTAVSHIRLL